MKYAVFGGRVYKHDPNSNNFGTVCETPKEAIQTARKYLTTLAGLVEKQMDDLNRLEDYINPPMDHTPLFLPRREYIPEDVTNQRPPKTKE